MMRSLLAKSALATLVAFYAGSAFAVFDFDVTGGKRWYESGSGDTKANIAAQEFDVTAHLDPSPLVPVSCVVIANVSTPRKDDLHATEAKAFPAGLDLQAWLPMVPVVTPHARLSLPLVSAWAYDQK